MNKKNVRKLINRLEGLLDSPQAAQFNMDYFGDAYFDGMRNVLEVPMCHTQACLAGEALLSTGQAEILPQGGLAITAPNGNRYSSWYVEEAAKKSLGLTEKESNNLFYLRSMLRTKGKYGWPEKFEAAYAAAKTPQGRLYVAIKRVEFFLKKGK